MRNNPPKDALGKVLRLSSGREIAAYAIALRGVYFAFACCAFRIAGKCYCYKAVLSEEHEKAVDWFERLTDTKRAWKFGSRILYLHNGQGSGWHPK